MKKTIVFIWSVTIITEYGPQVPTLLVIVTINVINNKYNYHHCLTNINGGLITAGFISTHDFGG